MNKDVKDTDKRERILKDYDASDSSKGLQIAATIIFILAFCGLHICTSQASLKIKEVQDEKHAQINIVLDELEDNIKNRLNSPDGQPVDSMVGPVRSNIHTLATDLVERNAKLSALSGIFAQILVLLSTAITLLAHKRGYFTAVIVDLLTIFSVIMMISKTHNYAAIPGIVVPISSIILITIIYFFSNNIIQKNKEISANYAKLLETNKMIREQDEKLSYLAYYDLLTDLPNRQLFIDKLDETILNSTNVPFTVLLANIDNFKQINNVYGNNAGDTLLNIYAEKLKEFSQDSLFLARAGGDEFGFIIQGNMTEANILNYVEKIQNIIGEPVQINDDFIQSTISIGIASYPNNAVTSGDLLKCLDNAKFFAKANGKNRPCFYGHQ